MSVLAKRYTAALIAATTPKDVGTLVDIFEALKGALNSPKTREVFFSPYMSDAVRQEILLDAIKSAKSDALNNFIKILVSKNRTALIFDIASELKDTYAHSIKSYTGSVQSDEDIKASAIKSLQEAFSKKLDATVDLELKKSDYKGVKVAVESLNVEIGLSKTFVRKQMIEHILKAI